MSQKKLFILLLSVMALTAVAQEDKKVAILPTVDVEGNVKYGIKFQLRASLTYAINQTPGYKGFDRVDISSIMSEQDFQRTGNVSNDQIKQLGIMTGAQYVLIAEAALYDDQSIIIAAKILDVETGGLIQSSPPVDSKQRSREDARSMRQSRSETIRTQRLGRLRRQFTHAGVWHAGLCIIEPFSRAGLHRDGMGSEHEDDMGGRRRVYDGLHIGARWRLQ